MKIIRHTARDMRQALRAVREQLGEDAVILSSRRTGEGVEVTAAIDFDAATLEGTGFASAPLPPPRIIDATPIPFEPPAATSPARRAPAALDATSQAARAPTAATRLPAAKRTAAGLSPAALDAGSLTAPGALATRAPTHSTRNAAA